MSQKFVDLSQDDNDDDDDNNNNNNNNNNSTSVKEENGYYKTTEVEFVPHYTTLTDTGKSHFNRIADGLAEFVDNSMEACKKGDVRDTKISISFFIEKGTARSAGFCVIADNGIGMDTKGLKEFAVFSLDQNTKRQANNDDNLGNFISKYGVGAKQAGFYLGSRMRVVTKTCNSDKVSELNLDRHQFEQRYRDGLSAFTTDIVHRNRCDTSRIPEEEMKWEKLVEFIKEHEKNKTFTYIVIKLEAEIVKTLFKNERFRILAAEMAEIYHFHLHPEHRPNHVMEKFSAKKLDTYKPQGNFRPSNNAGMKIEMLLTVWSDIGCLVEPQLLNDDTRNPIARYIDKAQHAFRFNIHVPHPVSSTALTQEEELNKLTIEGIIFYYPYDQGETRPDTKPDHIYNPTSDDSKEDDKKAGPTFSTFWVNRLVPASFVNKLPFFPKTNKKLIEENIPLDWLNRVKGFLFFDRDFPITNNKLRIQIDPDIDSWLNDKKVENRDVINFQPRTAPDEFRKWLKACHKSLDREFKLATRDHELHRIKNCDPSRGCFKQLHVLGDKLLIVQKDDIVKFNIKIPGKNVPQTVYGKVVTFDVEAAGDVYDILTTKIRYSSLVDKRDYEQLEQFPFAPISALDLKSEKADYKVTKKEIEALEKLKPSRLDVFIFKNKGQDGHLCKEAALQKIPAGEPIYKIGVKIFNEKGDTICQRPQYLNNNSKYKIKLTLDKDGPESIDFGTTSDLWFYNDEKEEEERKDKKDVSNCFYCYFGNKSGGYEGMQFNVVGKHTLSFELIDSEAKDLIVLLHKVDILVESKEVGGFKLDFSDQHKELQLGDGIPEFQVIFKDKFGNDFNYVGKIMTKITCPHMEIYCLGNKQNKLAAPQWQIDEDDEGKIPFTDDQWNILPQENLFSESLAVVEKVFTFELSEMIGGGKEIKKIGEQSFTLRFGPGQPERLILIDPIPECLPIEVTNNESIDSVTIAVLDKFGNRTAPKGKNVWRLIASDSSDCNISVKDAPVVNTGEGTLSDIKVSADDHIGADGLKTNVLVKLVGARDSKNKDISISDLAIPIRIIASTYPSELKVFYQGTPLIENSIFPCNSVISDLSFKLYDNNQQEIEFSPDVFSGKDSYLKLSWVEDDSKFGKKGKRSSKSSIAITNVLPDITIDSKIESPILEFTIDAVVFDKSNLSTSFAIRVCPGPAKGWKLITGPKFADGIMSDDANDLKSKLLCVCMMDEFENIIAADENLKPKLFIKSIDPTDEMELENRDDTGNASEDRQIRLVYRSSQIDPPSMSAADRKNKNVVKLPNINSFIVDSDESLQANPAPASVWLHVSDEQNRFASTSQRCTITNGLPSAIKLSSTAFNRNTPEIQPSISVSTFTSALPITLHFQDKSGNDGMIKSGIELIVTVLDGDNEEQELMKIKSIKSMSHNITVSIDSAMSKVDRSAEGFILRFEGSYTFDKEIVALEPAQMFCSIQKMNAVVDFKAYALYSGEANHDVANNCIAINCSNELPSIALEAITDDGQVFTPSLSDLEVIVTSVGNHNVTNINHSLSIIDNRCIIKLSSSSSPLQVGGTKITVKYEEKRPNILTLNLVGMREVEKIITLNILPDPPSVLKLDNRSIGKLNNLFVSLHRLEISSLVQFVIVDQHDNPCAFPPTMIVKCRVVHAQESDSDDESDVPTLQLASADGSIIAKIDKARTTATFSKLSIASMDGDEGNFNLEFIAVDEGSGQSVRPLIFPFKIFSDAHIDVEVARIREKMGPIEESISNYETDLTRLKSQNSKISKDIDSLLMSAKTGRLKALNSDIIDGNNIQNTLSSLEDQRRSFADQTQIRSAKKKESPTPEQLRDVPVIGMVVDLGFVNDLNNAKILSWAAQGYMKTVVVENFDLSKKLYSRGVKSWAISGIVPFDIKNKENPLGRPRNETERRGGKLFGTLEGTYEIPGGIQGNPEYLVELINLNDESLRDTIFYNVFKRQLLFDDLDTAIKYREWMVRRRRSVPTIYTRTGEKLAQEGHLDPVGGKMPENLDYVFGQTKGQHGSDYKNIEHDIDTCKNLLNSIVNRDKIRNDLDELSSRESDYEMNKQDMATYQAELKALNWSNKSMKRDSKRGRDNNVLVDDEQLLKRVTTDDNGAVLGGDENNDRNRKRRLEE